MGDFLESGGGLVILWQTLGDALYELKQAEQSREEGALPVP